MRSIAFSLAALAGMIAVPAMAQETKPKPAPTAEQVKKDPDNLEGLNAFFIMPAVARGFSLSSLFATHPPVQKRIERLMAMQADIDAGPVAAA